MREYVETPSCIIKPHSFVQHEPEFRTRKIACLSEKTYVLSLYFLNVGARVVAPVIH